VNARVGKADYSSIASTYDAGRQLLAGTIRQWVSLIRDRGKISPGSLCMDLGCGTGRFTIPLAETTGAHVVGVDLSAEMLAEALPKPGADRVWWVRSDAQDLAFKSGALQCVFMSLLLHHVSDAQRVLDECCRILRPEGVCVIRMAGHDDMETMPVYEFFPRAWEIDRNRVPDIVVIEDSMRRAGFRTVGHEKVVQKQVDSVDAYLDKMRRKNISALTLLSEDEFSAGMARLEEYVRSVGEEAFLAEVAEEQMTLVIGEK